MLLGCSSNVPTVKYTKDTNEWDKNRKAVTESRLARKERLDEYKRQAEMSTPISDALVGALSVVSDAAVAVASHNKVKSATIKNTSYKPNSSRALTSSSSTISNKNSGKIELQEMEPYEHPQVQASYTTPRTFTKTQNSEKPEPGLSCLEGGACIIQK